MADTLVGELRARDHEAELVTIPFKWYPGTRVLDQAFLWRLLDLTESDGQPIDLVLATKFPSYVVRHPNKRVWVLHQFRQAYELDRTDLGQFSEEPHDRALRRSVQTLDRVALGEAKRLFATSRNVAERIERSTGLAAEVLPHPPQELPYRNDGYGDFGLSVGRLRSHDEAGAPVGDDVERPAGVHCRDHRLLGEQRLVGPDAAGAVGDRGLQRPPTARAARADRYRGRQTRPDPAGTGH